MCKLLLSKAAKKLTRLLKPEDINLLSQVEQLSTCEAKLINKINLYKPDILITTYPTRNLNGSIRVGHPDHMAAGEASLAAVFPSARDHLTFPELFKDGLKPHKVKEWIHTPIENEEEFNQIVHDLCELYSLAPSLHESGTHVISCDEKTGIQALTRETTPMKPNQCERHDSSYERHGTQCLIANF